jgi:hypothetical protein
VLANPTFFFFFPSLPVVDPIVPLASSSAFFLALTSASSLALSSSLFSLGATYSSGAKLLTSKLKLVEIPDKFFKINF